MSDDLKDEMIRWLKAQVDSLQCEVRELRARRSGESVRELPPVDDATLTEREIEVGRGILIGKHRAEIAEDLGISLDTVKSHADNIYKKLGIHSRRELRLHKRLFEAEDGQP